MCWRRQERGSLTVEMAVLMPTLLLATFLGIQAAMFYHAGTLASAAAREGVRVAAAENGSSSAGIAEAHAFTVDVAGDSLTNVNVTGRRSSTSASITVTGKALTVIPGWVPSVKKSASLPVERITR